MRRFALLGLCVMAGCVNSPPMDNPSSPNAIRPESQDRMEARQLERAEADCAAQGKHAVSRRSEGMTVYDCAE
ncbi:MAG: hypothetical protein JSS29_01260 [Proteobacteria bacterium]|nr:hypothetical protein [Pseudomonadota bacterium]